MLRGGDRQDYQGPRSPVTLPKLQLPDDIEREALEAAARVSQQRTIRAGTRRLGRNQSGGNPSTAGKRSAQPWRLAVGMP